MVKLTAPPSVNVPPSGVFTTFKCGGAVHVVSPSSDTLDGLALVDVAVAVFTRWVQAAGGAPPALVIVTTTVWDAPAASVPKLQLSVCVPSMLQSVPGPGVTLVTPQVRPPVVG